MNLLTDRADFVEENGPTMGFLETSFGGFSRARVGASFVAKKFAGDEFGRHRAGVDSDVRAIPSPASFMDRRRHQVLARARLTGDQNGYVLRRRLKNPLKNLTHGQARPEHALELQRNRYLLMKPRLSP